MNLSGNTVLITGGASGIGLALAERFLESGNKVIVCGRREQKLEEAKQKYPQLITRICDVSVESERLKLVDWVKSEHPEVNVLVNNAGIQQRVNLLEADEPWSYYHQEIAANVEAPFHLSMLFIPQFKEQNKATFINISSGLAFTPMANAPIYCATKAALHSFTVSLRHQLRNTNVGVIEVAPPAVNTDLGGPGLHTFGVPVDEFAKAVLAGIEKGELEIGYGTSERSFKMSSEEMAAAFQRLNNRF